MGVLGVYGWCRGVCYSAAEYGGERCTGVTSRRDEQQEKVHGTASVTQQLPHRLLAQWCGSTKRGLVDNQA